MMEAPERLRISVDTADEALRRFKHVPGFAQAYLRARRQQAPLEHFLPLELPLVVDARDVAVQFGEPAAWRAGIAGRICAGDLRIATLDVGHVPTRARPSSTLPFGSVTSPPPARAAGSSLNGASDAATSSPIVADDGNVHAREGLATAPHAASLSRHPHHHHHLSLSAHHHHHHHHHGLHGAAGGRGGGSSRYSSRLKYGACAAQGPVPHMENEHTMWRGATASWPTLTVCYIGIFDGHGGRRAAQFCREQMMFNIMSTAEYVQHLSAIVDEELPPSRTTSTASASLPPPVESVSRSASAPLRSHDVDDAAVATAPPPPLAHAAALAHAANPEAPTAAEAGVGVDRELLHTRGTPLPPPRNDPGDSGRPGAAAGSILPRAPPPPPPPPAIDIGGAAAPGGAGGDVGGAGGAAAAAAAAAHAEHRAMHTALREGFLRTDRDFLRTVVRPDLGSGAGAGAGAAAGGPPAGGGSEEAPITDYVGCTALTALLVDDTLFIAWAGDCRAVLCRGGRAHALSADHRPGCERERLRVESLGGFVADGRVGGFLGVCRAIGDFDPKSGAKLTGLSATPDSAHIRLSDKDEFLILGCDGLWEVVSTEAATALARAELLAYGDAQMAAERLVEEALKRHVDDNVTVQVVTFGNSFSSDLDGKGGAGSAPRERPRLKLAPRRAPVNGGGSASAAPSPGTPPAAGARHALTPPPP